MSVLPGTHLALLDQEAPLGSVPDATPMKHMPLMLKRSGARQSALDALIAAQHDTRSTRFQQWLTPHEFGSSFGVADSDIAATTSWLISQGFTVNGVYPNKMQIDFSGTAGQVSLAAQEYGGSAGTPPASLATCNANNGATGTSACVFHNVTSGNNSVQCLQQLPAIATPDCYFYGTVSNFYYPGVGFVGPVQAGLTSTSAAVYSSQTVAYPAQPGWSFATGLGSVNATNLLAAWEKFVNAP